MSNGSIRRNPGSYTGPERPSTVLRAEFGLGEEVYVDKAVDVKTTIIAFSWRGSAIQAEVSWFNGGALQSVWVDIDRLSRFP